MEADATYTFAGLSPGPYHLVVQYPPDADNAPASRYAVSSGELETSFVLDQREAYQGQWRLVGDFFSSGGVASVRIGQGPEEGLLHAGQIKVISYECRDCEGHPLP
jgi:hypothetical protein